MSFKIWVCVLLVFISTSFAKAETSNPLWVDLKPGSYQSGFDVFYHKDFSRIWNSAKNEPRPIRLSVWYPAQRKNTSRRLIYKDYIHLPVEDPEFKQLNEILSSRNLITLQDVVPDAQSLKKLFETPMASYRKATPASGKFPVVAYASGLNETWQHANFVLGEYLASHGFIVVAVPQLGPSRDRQNLRNNAIDLETQVRDVEFAIGAMRKFPNADQDKVAIMGHSIGGIVSHVLQMRNSNVDAIITLDSPHGWKNSAQWLTGSQYYQPKLVRVPLLDLRREDQRFDLSVFQAFKYSNRYLASFPGIMHSDFTSFPMIALNFKTNMMGRTPAAAATAYQAICSAVLSFLEMALKKNGTNEEIFPQVPENVMRTQFLKAREAPPTEEELVRMIQEEGYEKTLQSFRAFKEKDPADLIIDTSLMTSIGYDLLSIKEYRAAIDVLKLVAEAKPSSADAHDSVAEAYLTSGNRDMAKKHYQRVLDLIAQDPDASAEQKESLKENALQKLKELQ